MTTPQPAALPELLREIVAYCREAGHDWSSLTEAEHHLAALQSQPAADWRDRLTVNLMRQGAGLTKTQIRALIAYAHDGVEPDPELFEQPAAAGVSDAEIDSIWQQHHVTNEAFGELMDAQAFEHAARAILALRPQAVPMTDEQRREVFMAGYEAAEQDATVCQVPPHGWHCTRKAGHEGPCAAVETDDAELVQRGMDRLREAHHGITAQGAQGGEV